MARMAEWTVARVVEWRVVSRWTAMVLARAGGDRSDGSGRAPRRLVEPMGVDDF